MLYNFDLFKKYQNLQVFFSQKTDGPMKLAEDPKISPVISQNRNIYFLKNNIDPKKVISAEIVHGSKAVVVHEKDSGKVMLGADGLITQSKGLYLSITSADCLPIFLFEPKKEAVGIIHAGWRSLEKNIIFDAVESIKKINSFPEEILAGIGPSICQKHYEVGKKIAKKFSRYPETIKEENRKTYLDLKKISQLQLMEAGLPEKNIEIRPECTFELSGKYFSARRDKPKQVKAMIAIIGLKV